MIALLMAVILTVHPSVPARTEHGIPVRGVASWYDATKNNAWYTRHGTRYYAAVGTFRWGDDPYPIKVCRADDRSRCVIVIVADYCGRCHKDLKRNWTKRSRSIDLSPHAFASLRSLHLGVVRVIIEEIQPGN